MFDLSGGTIATLMAGGQVDKPLIQILAIRKVSKNERFRLNISDGEQSCSFAMLATQLNHLVENNVLDRFAVIRVENYVCNFIPPDKRVLVILEATLIAPGLQVGRELGAPKAMKTATTGETSGASGGGGGGGGMPPPQATGASHFSSNRPQVPQPAKIHGGTFFGNRLNSSSSSDSNRTIHPIVGLTPYQNRWTIRVRVTNKSSVRTWSNSRGEGKLFSMDLLDESGEIRATCFNDQCDKFYNMVELNKVYYVSRGVLKTANKNFTSIKNDYEMSFNAETTMELCSDASVNLPVVKFSFVPIASLVQKDKDMLVDVIGVTKKIGEVQTFTARSTNKELKKRELFLVDSSNTEVSLTLWGDQAENFVCDGNPVVAIKGARLSDYGGRSLSSLSSSMLLVDPNISEAQNLRAWYTDKGVSSNMESISKLGTGAGLSANWKMLRQVKLENLGAGEKADYYTVMGTIVFLKKDNCMYKACVTEGCNKKVIDLNNGKYRCEKCNREFDQFTWRLLLQVNIADCTDSQWVTCFQDSAEILLDTTAIELGELKDMDDLKFQMILSNAHFKTMIFKLRSKVESFNDENRLKSTVVTATPINFVEQNAKLIADIGALVK